MNTMERAKKAYNEAVERMNTAADAVAEAKEGADTRALMDAFEASERDVITAKEELGRLDTIDRARRDHTPVDVENPVERTLPEAEGRAGSAVRVTREPATYERGDKRTSYLLDLARDLTGRGDSGGAKVRLARHGAEIRTYVEETEKRAERVLDVALQSMLAQMPDQRTARAIEGQLVEKRAISRIDGQGGDFVPPVWLLEEYAAFARAGRPFADAMRNIPLPEKTDSINIPRITSGTATASQANPGAAVQSTDLTTGTVNAPVVTIAGQQDLELQLLEQSPLAFDEIVFADLVADYNVQLDTQLLNGSGAGGQILGILNTIGTNSVTYTDGTPTVPELYPKLADALNQASNNRKLVPSHFWWAGRRWFWAAKEVDVNNRPFFIAASNGPQNTYGLQMDSMNQGGPVTNVLGVPVMLDLSVPTNLGAGTNEDRIIATRMFDHILFEGQPRARAMSEVLSGNLQVRLQVYTYAAATFGRFPAATSIVSGTGLVTPTF